MAVDRRLANGQWFVADDQGHAYSTIRQGVMLSVLMDIRDELRTIRQRVNCLSFIGMPSTLTKIERNTRKPKRRKPK